MQDSLLHLDTSYQLQVFDLISYYGLVEMYHQY